MEEVTRGWMTGSSRKQHLIFLVLHLSQARWVLVRFLRSAAAAAAAAWSCLADGEGVTWV